jgi:hypothetical protein
MRSAANRAISARSATAVMPRRALQTLNLSTIRYSFGTRVSEKSDTLCCKVLCNRVKVTQRLVIALAVPAKSDNGNHAFACVYSLTHGQFHSLPRRYSRLDIARDAVARAPALACGSTPRARAATVARSYSFPE